MSTLHIYFLFNLVLTSIKLSSNFSSNKYVFTFIKLSRVHIIEHINYKYTYQAVRPHIFIKTQYNKDKVKNKVRE